MNIMVRFSIAFAILFGFSSLALSQQHQCISEHHLEHNHDFSKQYQQKVDKILANKRENKSFDNLGNITIPIVVHVVYNTDQQNISDAQIESQIDVLNVAFNMEAPWITGIYPQATDTDIHFVLANVDPNGNSTNGITRTNTSVSIFSIAPGQPLDWEQNTYMKLDEHGGKDAWPSEDYLNIWVINCQYYIKGFGTFPGSIDSNLDGIVMNYKYFGNIGTGITYTNYTGGKSCVHEVGHWLDLRHLFANDCEVNDGLDDTPAQDDYYYSCAEPIEECGNTLMLENYMQYTYDQCQMVYTEDQKTVMRSNFLDGGLRESILNSNGFDNSNSARIFGNFYHDIDQDEEIDSNEPMYADINISLYNCNHQLLQTKTSDSDGFYEFTNLSEGQYYILVDPNSLPSDKGPDPIFLSTGSCADIQNGFDYLQSFGLLSYASVGGKVWEDTNANGIMQSTEPSIDAATILLRKPNGSIIQQTYPSADGTYIFTEVYPDEYYLEFILSSDYHQTLMAEGNNYEDNDVANFYGNNTTQIHNLSQGQIISNIGAGFYLMAEVNGHVWNDYNYNGLFDNGESGMESIVVNLYNDQFQVVKSTVTNTDGLYVIEDISPSQYYLSIDPVDNMSIIPQPLQAYYFDQSNGPNTSPFFSFMSGTSIDNLNAGLGFGTVALQDLRLSGRAEPDYILLEWDNLTGEEFQHFNLQKKKNGNWVNIFEGSDFNINHFRDDQIDKRTNYYRIQLTGQASNTITSNVVAIEYEGIETLLVFQNPVSEKVHITFNNKEFAKIRLNVFDNQRCLEQIDIYGSELDSHDQYELNFSNYPPGMYFINYQIGNLTHTKKLIKI